MQLSSTENGNHTTDLFHFQHMTALFIKSNPADFKPFKFLSINNFFCLHLFPVDMLKKPSVLISQVMNFSSFGGGGAFLMPYTQWLHTDIMMKTSDFLHHREVLFITIKAA
jgi:hypothetical protein